MGKTPNTYYLWKTLRFFSSMVTDRAPQSWEPKKKSSPVDIFKRVLFVTTVVGLVLWFTYTQLHQNYPFNWRLILRYRHDFWVGFLLTLKISVVSLIFSLATGVMIGIGRVSRRMIFSDLTLAYVEWIRNIPLLVIVLLVYFGFGSVFPISRFFAGVLALTIFQAAYIAEIIRAGIQSVGRGQFWAARSLGLSSGITMRYIILPQVLKRITPALAGQSIYLIQGSSLCSVISLAELTLTARRILTVTYASMESYLTLTFFYFVVCAVLSLCTKLIERKLAVE
ncbi:MAG: ABC transporter permease subunit [Proteobacteria bacterium]|nr:ABC transporter permease subunit [Pseudomonadota bacterium]